MIFLLQWMSINLSSQFTAKKIKPSTKKSSNLAPTPKPLNADSPKKEKISSSPLKNLPIVKASAFPNQLNPKAVPSKNNNMYIKTISWATSPSRLIFWVSRTLWCLKKIGSRYNLLQYPRKNLAPTEFSPKNLKPKSTILLIKTTRPFSKTIFSQILKNPPLEKSYPKTKLSDKIPTKTSSELAIK